MTMLWVVFLFLSLAAHGQTREIIKMGGNVSLYPYSPKSVNKLSELPANIQEKVAIHLIDRLGDDFYKNLKFTSGVVVSFDDLRRVRPNADFKWKVFTYDLEYTFAMRDEGIKSYAAHIWLDEKGDVLKEIDLPAIRQNPDKAKIISVQTAMKIGKANGFRTSWVALDYRKEDDSIVWQLHRPDKDGGTLRIDISAHNGKILNTTGWKGIP